jgi:tetratricopeptide (TPR) repeat protein
MKTAAFAAILTVAAAAALRAADNDPNARIAHVEQWLKAVLEHSSGTPDRRVVEISAWPTAALTLFEIDLSVFLRLLRDPRLVAFEKPAKEATECIPCIARGADAAQARQIGRPQPIRYTDWQLHRLRVLACAAAGTLTSPVCLGLKAPVEIDADLHRLADGAEASQKRGDDNYVLRRGALLEADVAMTSANVLYPIETGAPGDQRPIRLHMVDGETNAIGIGETHWVIGRTLLDVVRPRGDGMINLWYRATAAWMQRELQYNPAHLRRARELFPNDSIVAFLSGTNAETYASAAIQAARKTAVLPTGVVLEIGNEAEELKSAEEFLARAVKADPVFREARLHLGHVLLARGKAREAADELTAALESREPLLRYYSAMFLGAAEEALGHGDAAQAAYRQAQAMFPRAQSPSLALSALALRRGDRTAAMQSIEEVFALPREAEARDDPWWRYHTTPGRNAADLLDELWKPFREKRQ